MCINASVEKRGSTSLSSRAKNNVFQSYRHSLPAPLLVPLGVNGSCSIWIFFHEHWSLFWRVFPPKPHGSDIHLAVPRLMSDSPCCAHGHMLGPAPALSGAGSKSQSPRSPAAQRGVTPGQEEAVTFPGSGRCSAGVWVCRWCPDMASAFLGPASQACTLLRVLASALERQTGWVRCKISAESAPLGLKRSQTSLDLSWLLI